MNKITLILISLFFTMISCKENVNNNVDEFELQPANFNLIHKLQENLSILGNPSSLAQMEDGKFVISDLSSPKIVIYNKEGNQERVIPAEGAGPLQFQSPSLVKYYNEKIYLWCSQQLKLITFTKEGQPIKEFKIFDRAISNFVPFENKIVAYTKGGFMDSYIQVYDLESEELVKSIGEVSNEQVLLDIFSCSGGLDLKNNILSYIASDKLEINKLDLKNMKSHKESLFHDSEFQVGEITTNPVDLVNSDFNQAVKFINENSTVTGIFSIDKGIVLISEVGQYEGDAQNGITSSSNRFNKYYILNDNYELKKVYKSRKIDQGSPCLISARNNTIFELSRNLNENDEHFVLKGFRIDL